MGVLVGVQDAVIVGVLVGVSDGVAEAGTSVLVGVSDGVAEGGTAVLVAVSDGVLDGPCNTTGLAPAKVGSVQININSATTINNNQVIFGIRFIKSAPVTRITSNNETKTFDMPNIS